MIVITTLPPYLLTYLPTITHTYHACILYIGLAYRLPDTNINLSGSYQQGKGNVQISCVPDEAMSLLGPNGMMMMMMMMDDG